ncbi:hypothetical protein LJR164_002516 [Phenylobacterium sp. LjRoot164]|uniref:hypothetical protein n=1 Tax=unclassified Phenylobacterium TaxID=2640670 RepID=UPI003ECCDC5E
MKQAIIIAACAFGLAAPAHAETLRQQFPNSKDEVYAALLQALPASGFKIQEESAAMARVSAKAPMSAMSFGERMTLSVVAVPSGGSMLEYTGAPVMSSNIVAEGRVVKHFDKIVFAVGERLTTPTPAS